MADKCNCGHGFCILACLKLEESFRVMTKHCCIAAKLGSLAQLPEQWETLFLLTRRVRTERVRTESRASDYLTLQVSSYGSREHSADCWPSLSQTAKSGVLAADFSTVSGREMLSNPGKLTYISLRFVFLCMLSSCS